MIEDMGDFGRGSVPPVPPPGEGRPSTARSKARGVAAGVGVALVVGAGGIAVASSGGTANGAAGATPTATEGAPTPAPGLPGPGGPGGPGGHGGGPFRMGPGIGFGGGVLHGTYVVEKAGGGYQTIQTQNGTVSAVSSTSLSVKSADGYSYTYVVKAGTIVDAQSAGITSVKKGDTVTVDATVSGKTATVDRVMDVTLLQKSMPSFKGGYGKLPGGPGRFRGPGGAPSPTTTPGSTT